MVDFFQGRVCHPRVRAPRARPTWRATCKTSAMPRARATTDGDATSATRDATCDESAAVTTHTDYTDTPPCVNRFFSLHIRSRATV